MITVDLTGFKEVFENLSTMAEDLKEEIDAELYEASRNLAGLAKNDLANKLSLNNNKKTGRLLGSINFAPQSPNGRLYYESFVQTNYAAYNEWGTITHVSVPPDLVDIAIKYKGKGIKKTGGMKPKHFFYSKLALVQPELINNLNNVIGDRLSK
jgi:hypothetical protein